MDLPTGIELATGIISVPSSLYVIFQIWRDSRTAKRFLEEASDTRKTYVNLISSLSDRSDRALLMYNKNNNEKPGTFEHLVWGYWKEFEALTQHSIVPIILPAHANSFIYNPAGTLSATSSSVNYYRQNRFVVIMMSLMLVSFLLPMGITSSIGELVRQGTVLHLALSILIFAILVPLGFALCWFSLRRNRVRLHNVIKALEVIRRYVALLEDMGIIVQQEFSQLKSKLGGGEKAAPTAVVGEAGS